MAGYLIEMFAVSLALTLLAELAAMYFLLGMPGLRSGKQEPAEINERGGIRQPAAKPGKGEAGKSAAGEGKSGTREPAAKTGKGEAGKLSAGDGKGVTQERVMGTEQRNAPWILLVILVNVLTNPPAVLICWLGRMYLTSALCFPLQLAVEAVVIVAEAAVYRSFSGKLQWETKNPVLLSAAANGCSWSMGILFMALR